MKGSTHKAYDIECLIFIKNCKYNQNEEHFGSLFISHISHTIHFPILLYNLIPSLTNFLTLITITTLTNYLNKLQLTLAQQLNTHTSSGLHIHQHNTAPLQHLHYTHTSTALHTHLHYNTLALALHKHTPTLAHTTGFTPSQHLSQELFEMKYIPPCLPT